MQLYDPNHIRNFYDKYADQETNRWNKSLIEKIKYLVHKHYLDKYLTQGDQVLELGAGTGMFTKHIQTICGQVTVTDLSPVQLELNKNRATAEDYLDKIQAWEVLDICDLSVFENQQFDCVVCYGGPLSYVFEQNRRAILEIKRVLKPGGVALLSVMNKWGSLNKALETILTTISIEDNEKIIATGNLHPSSFTSSDHHCHMYTAQEFTQILTAGGFEVVELSASNCLSVRRAEALQELECDRKKWDYFLDLEIRACKSPGMIESGTHLIAVLRA